MSALFAIQVFGLSGEDFVFGRPAIVVMWDENFGPVYVGYPIMGPVFTVYAWGDTAMEASAGIGLPNRIVSLTTKLTDATNTLKLGSARANPISFDIRQTGAGGGSGVFYNYATNGFTDVAFSNASGSNLQITKGNAKEARAFANTAPGTKYDLFQQLYRRR